MEEKQQRAIQKQVIDYFKHIDDATFIAVVESFVYHLPAKNEKVSKIITSFLEENDLELAYVNYVSDFVEKEQQFFNRSSWSQRGMIEGLKSSFLNDAFNRFRRSAGLNEKLTNDFREIKNSIDKLMDAGQVERFDEAMDELREYHFRKDK